MEKSLIGAKSSDEYQLNESSKLSKLQTTTMSDYEFCGKSSRCEWCQKCPGLSLAETGSELMPSAINCRNAAARMIG